jgi:hypothetical protein
MLNEMSEQQRMIDTVVKWGLRIALTVLSIFGTFFINNLTNSFRAIEINIEVLKTEINQMRIQQAIMNTQLRSLEIQVEKLEKRYDRP